jgi:hypothetical protein
MKESNKTTEKTCLLCERILDEGCILGVCPHCVNKQGKGAILVILAVGGLLLKIYSGKLLKFAIKLIRR